MKSTKIEYVVQSKTPSLRSSHWRDRLVYSEQRKHEAIKANDEKERHSREYHKPPSVFRVVKRVTKIQQEVVHEL